jgi:hypothetical protein
MSVCPDCHLCFHLGYANVNGKLSAALDRLAALNNWSRVEVETYDHTVVQRWEHASQIHWMLDFGDLVHPDGGLTLEPGWQLHRDVARFLVYENRLGHENVTALLNTRWRTSGEKKLAARMDDARPILNILES